MAGGVKVSVAFNDPTLDPTPTWTDLTALTPTLVAGYEIDRGRIFELDQTDAGVATVTINDRDGVLDPTNAGGAYYGLLEPLLQIKIELWNPVTSDWHSRFRGFIEDFDYTVDPAQVVSRLTIQCMDIMALTTSIEMQPGEFGDDPTLATFNGEPVDATGNIFFASATFEDRISQVLGNAGIPAAFFVVFTGNVRMLPVVYAPGQNVMEVIQDCADAELPGVSNVYPDRFGRLAAHGRLAKFDPATIAAGAGDAAWDYRNWKCGDGTAVAAAPGVTAQIRPPFSWNRGLSKIINSALAYPADATPAEIAGQVFTDPTSIELRGIRTWSKENLLTEIGLLTGLTGLAETAKFAEFQVTAYKEPRNRITALTFKSMRPGNTGATATWLLLSKVDISDTIEVTVDHPGGGGFAAVPFFIEGVKETCEPLHGDYALVTTSLDVSPRAIYDDPVGLDGV